MYDKLITQMQEVVEEYPSVYCDFTYYDKPAIERATPEQFPMLWVVENSCTTLINFQEYREDFFEHSPIRQHYLNGFDTMSYYLDSETCDCQRVYLVKREGIEEIPVEQAREIIRTEVAKVVSDWEELHGPMGVPRALDLTLVNMEEGDMEKLFADCDEHNDTSLADIVRRLTDPGRRRYDDHRIRLTYDEEMQKIVVKEEMCGDTHFYGVIVFHGWPETGYQKNGSFSLGPSYGWEMHT